MQRPAHARRQEQDLQNKQAPFLFWHKDTLVLPVKINGVDARAILDTGAARSVVDPGFAGAMGIATADGGYGMVAPGGSAQVRKAEPIRVAIGRAEFMIVSAAISDLSAVSTAMGWPIGCILGQELFTRYIVDIRFDEQFLTVHSPETYAPPAKFLEHEARSGKEGQRTIAISVEGQAPVEAMIDSGSSSPLLLSAVYAETIGLKARRGSTSLSATGKGVMTTKMVTVRQLEVGGLLGRAVPTKLYDEWPLTHAPAIIGLPLLAAAGRLIVDFSGNRIWLPPTSKRLPAMRRDRSGLGLVAKPDRLVVVHVAEGSPVATGGWRKDDAIIEVNGERIDSSYNSGRLWRWRYQPAGTNVRLKLIDGSIRSIKLDDYF